MEECSAARQWAKRDQTGEFRICDLAPGEYRLIARSRPNSGLTNLGATDVVIVDRDVSNLRVGAPLLVALLGEVAWAGEAPAELETREIAVSIRPVYRAPFREELNSASSKGPGDFTYGNLATDAYEIRVLNLAEDWYVADIEYGGRSIRNEMLRIGSAPRDSRLRITIGRDAGRIEAVVKEEDGEPVMDADVYALPESAASEVELADAMKQGQTDQRGVYDSGALRPGKYRIVATRQPIDLSPESIRRLWLARPNAAEATIEPGSEDRIDGTLTGL